MIKLYNILYQIGYILFCSAILWLAGKFWLCEALGLHPMSYHTALGMYVLLYMILPDKEPFFLENERNYGTQPEGGLEDRRNYGTSPEGGTEPEFTE